jgi:signal transduction histidine kinase
MYQSLRILSALLLSIACTLVQAQVSVTLDTIKANRVIKLLYADNYPEALRLLGGIQEQFVYNEPTPEYIQLLIDVGGAYNEKGNYESSQQYLFEALQLAMQQKLVKLECIALLEIGYAYYFLEQIDKSIEFGKLALDKAELQGYEVQAGTANNLLGILHTKKKMGKVAMDYLEASLAIRKKVHDVRGVASTISNIALQYEEDGNYEKALEYQVYSLSLDDSLNNLYGVAWSNQMIGSLLIKMNRTDEASKRLEAAESLAYTLQAREILLQTFKNKSQVFSQQKNFKQALHYADAYNMLRDSIYNSGLAGKVMLLQQSYEMRDRDRQIAIQQASLEMQQKYLLFVCLALALGTVMLFFYYRLYRKTLVLNRDVAERNEEIQAQSEELVEANEALHVLNVQMAEQKEEIQAQAEELTESNQIIQKLNHHLQSEVERKSQDLVKTNEELVKHNNELLQFSFTVSHNLRGPVARLLGLMNLIGMNDREHEKEGLIKLLHQSTLDLDGVLKDLNLIIDSRNKLFKVREKILLDEEWVKCFSLLRDYIKPEYQLQADFSEPFVYSIRAMIQSIFYNLVSNAIKYQSPDRPLRVSISSYKTAEGVVLQVKDNGLGIDLSQQRDNLFKLYKRFHTHVAGKGLGLYLVKTQLEVLGGKIDVESELNVGSTFKIFIPNPDNIKDQIFYENEAARLCYDANINNTVIFWKRAINSREYREVFETVLQTLRTYNTPAWIADLRLQGVVTDDDQQWFMKTVLPEAVRCGLKRIGTIGFKDPAREAYYQRMIKRSADLGIELRVFETMEGAKQWMESILANTEGNRVPVG